MEEGKIDRTSQNRAHIKSNGIECQLGSQDITNALSQRVLTHTTDQ